MSNQSLTLTCGGQRHVDPRACEILQFWFSSEVKPKWFSKDAEFDQLIRDRFLDLYYLARNRQLNWQHNMYSLLALILLLDQFPRNMFRDSPEAFATDAVARALTHKAIKNGWHRKLPPLERMFLYLPLQHSENMQDQSKSVDLFTKLKNAAGALPFFLLVLSFALKHQHIIQRFGRFPHRNKALSREPTMHEMKYQRVCPSPF